nr:hypothetical protein [Allomuricauda sp.]
MELQESPTPLKTYALLGLVTLIIIIFLASCESEADGLDGSYKVVTSTHTFYSDPVKYRLIHDRRANPDVCNVKTKISKVQRTGSIIKVTVQRPKNCDIKYEVIWDGLIAESFPAQAHLYVDAIGNACNGDFDGTDVLEIDLKKSLRKVDDFFLENIVMYIKETCELKNFGCPKDCNITVTD